MQGYFLFQGLVQVLQTRYQKKRHYALRSMGFVRHPACLLFRTVVLNGVCLCVCVVTVSMFVCMCGNWQVTSMDVSATETLTEMHSGLYVLLVFVFLTQAFQVSGH